MLFSTALDASGLLARAQRADKIAGEAKTTCPNCDVAHSAGDVFCENCGYDFLTGTLPDEGAAAAASAKAAQGEVPLTVAVISIDLAFFDAWDSKASTRPRHCQKQ